MAFESFDISCRSFWSFFLFFFCACYWPTFRWRPNKADARESVLQHRGSCQQWRDNKRTDAA